MSEQHNLALSENGVVESVEEYRFKPPRRPIRGYPELWWAGKRPFTSTRYYPAQLKETYGEAVDGVRADETPIRGWRNKLYWGDNLQVMSHLLKEFRGQVDLVYIDPPFDSKADYKKTVKLKGKQVSNDHSAFEEKQYSDIWTNDEYLQFMYERLILLRELLAETGSIWVHCDHNASHHIRCLLDEVFGSANFRNSIAWKRTSARSDAATFSQIHDTLFFYSKSEFYDFYSIYIKYSKDYIESKYSNIDKEGRRYQLTDITSPNPRPNMMYDWRGFPYPPKGWRYSLETMKSLHDEGRIWYPDDKSKRPRLKRFLDEQKGRAVQSVWNDINPVNSQAAERLDYPTQKPEDLLARVIEASSLPGSLVLDVFSGSGTTQSVAAKMGRRFLGADINLGAIQTTTKRLIQVAKDLSQGQGAFNLDGEDDQPGTLYTGFEVYNVNHYDVFRNPTQAKDLLLEALEVQPLEASALYDGEKDGRMVKVMPVNRLATKQDLNELLTGFDLKTFEKRKQAQPNRPVEKITLVCMGHDPELKPTLVRQVREMGYAVDVEVVDVLRDRQDLQFKREAEASIDVEEGQLTIEAFYPMNLLQKLSLMKENVEDWREMVESVMIDWNYDGAVLTPQVVDVPEGDALVRGRYPVPDDAGTIRVKITDLLSESLEVEVEHG